MNLFKKREAKKEMGEFPELPKLPKLPGLPELPDESEFEKPLPKLPEYYINNSYYEFSNFLL